MDENLKTQNTGVDTNTDTSTTGTETKTYTQEEVDKMLQSEVDRRITSALKKQAKSNEAKIKEAQKLAQMNESEKYQYELEQREKAIEEKEKALALAENKNEASKILADKGLSLSLVDFVIAEDAETMNSNIRLLEKAFKDSVKREVEKRLGSSAPKKNLPPDETITKEQAKKMGIRERQQLLMNNPELYAQLFN